MKNRQQIDVWFGRMMITALGLTPVASVVGAITLAMTGESIPALLVVLGPAAIGGLAGFLVPSHLNR